MTEHTTRLGLNKHANLVEKPKWSPSDGKAAETPPNRTNQVRQWSPGDQRAKPSQGRSERQHEAPKRRCVQCSAELAASKYRNARYCSVACKQRSYRQRVRAADEDDMTREEELELELRCEQSESKRLRKQLAINHNRSKKLGR